MSPIITMIKLINYKRFTNYTIEPNRRINVFVGDNEVGKSTVLEAIDIVANGSVRRVEAIGIEKLINKEAILQFNSGIRNFDNLPKLTVEIYLEGSFDHTMNGRNNTLNKICDGLRLVCEPNNDFLSEITESLIANLDYFPYDYYSIRFSTFADEGYSGYRKKIKSILIDSTSMSSEFATNDFIKRMYNQYTEDDVKERAVHKSEYRQFKSSFSTNSLRLLNDRIPANKNYKFGLRAGLSLSLENDLMIYEDEIGIDSKGTGKQVFIKTDFAMERSGENVDIILIEEPENHLSHVNLRKLIKRVSETRDGQLFITTHNSLISTRLEMKNLLIMHSGSSDMPTSLKRLNDETAKYFMKAPVANVIEFALSNKIILVEGPSEYLLFEKFYEDITDRKPEDDNVQIMDVRGLSFKRYLEVANLLGSKVAVVTDNDGDYQKNCKMKYQEYDGNTKIRVFCEENVLLNTFEKTIHSLNQDLCRSIFKENAENYMLSNKTESAFELLSQGSSIEIPDYIKDAIKWISE